MLARVYILATTKTVEKENSTQARARILGALFWLPPIEAPVVSMVVSQIVSEKEMSLVSFKSKEDGFGGETEESILYRRLIRKFG